MGNKNLDDLISKMGDLPALPGVVGEVLRITEDPSSAMSDVTRALERDPALTAKILRLSNSSYYGMRQQVGTLKLALVILGVREVRNIVLGISVFETLKEKSNDHEAAEIIWTDSLKVAGISKQLAVTVGLGLQGEDFITGLLADMGKMLLLWQLKKEYGALMRQFRWQPRRLLLDELGRVGYSHADAATALAVRWSLPKTLSDSLWTQYPHAERPLRQAKDPRLAALVRISKAAYFDDFSKDEDLDSMEDVEAWQVFNSVRRPIESGQRREVLTGIKEEISRGGDLLL